MASDTDRIEKEIVINAPREKVWRALTDAKQFGAWFGVDISGTFEPGARIEGRILHEKWSHVPFVIDIDRVVAGVLLAWRWANPDPTGPIDLSQEPSSYVTFELSDAPGGGTHLKVIESGLDALPASRRASVFRDNTNGWTSQMQNIRKYVEG